MSMLSLNVSQPTNDQSKIDETAHLPLKKEIEAAWDVPSSHRAGFSLDEPPYLITTECGQVEALEELSQKESRPNGVLLGFANEFNYNILATRQVKRAIICDINKRMHTFYNWVADNINKYESPEEFLKALKSYIDSQPDYYLRFPPTSNELMQHYRQSFMWTSNVESYQKVRDMYLSRKITHINLDLIADSAYFDDLRLWAERNGYVFDTVYVSNIFEWAQRKGGGHVSKAKANLLKIFSPSTLFIDAKQIEFEKGEPKIRISSEIRKGDDFPSFLPSRKRKKAISVLKTSSTGSDETKDLSRNLFPDDYNS